MLIINIEELNHFTPLIALNACDMMTVHFHSDGIAIRNRAECYSKIAGLCIYSSRSEKNR